MNRKSVSSFVVSLFAALSFSVAAQARECRPEINPHTFECHDDAFQGRTEFPVVAIDWVNVISGDWKATTYAVPGSNEGSGFRMIKDPSRPTRPEGVVNVFMKSRTSPLGELSFTGTRAIFSNWQNAVLISEPDSLLILDRTTVEFRAIDRFHTEHLFSCRDFIRNRNHHLNCRWSTRPENSRSQWVLNGYFGFLHQ